MNSNRGIHLHRLFASFPCQMARHDTARHTKIEEKPLCDVEMKVFADKKIPKMPAWNEKFGVLPLKVLCR